MRFLNLCLVLGLSVFVSYCKDATQAAAQKTPRPGYDAKGNYIGDSTYRSGSDYTGSGYDTSGCGVGGCSGVGSQSTGLGNGLGTVPSVGNPVVTQNSSGIYTVAVQVTSTNGGVLNNVSLSCGGVAYPSTNSDISTGTYYFSVNLAYAGNGNNQQGTYGQQINQQFNNQQLNNQQYNNQQGIFGQQANANSVNCDVMATDSTGRQVVARTITLNTSNSTYSSSSPYDQNQRTEVYKVLIQETAGILKTILNNQNNQNNQEY